MACTLSKRAKITKLFLQSGFIKTLGGKLLKKEVEYESEKNDLYYDIYEQKFYGYKKYSVPLKQEELKLLIKREIKLEKIPTIMTIFTIGENNYLIVYTIE